MARYGVTSVVGQPPTITFPLLLSGSVGALLIYCAIIGKTPVAVLKDAFNQQPQQSSGAFNQLFEHVGAVAQAAAEGPELGNYTTAPVPKGTSGTTTKKI